MMSYRASLFINVVGKVEVCKVSLYIKGQHVVSILPARSSGGNVLHAMRCSASVFHCFYSAYSDITGKFSGRYGNQKLRALTKSACYQLVSLMEERSDFF